MHVKNYPKNMKRSYIAFVFDVDGYLKPYTKHPLFTGEVAPDCARPAGASGVSPSPMICGKLNVREFEGVGQALAAVSDYQKGYHIQDPTERAKFVPEKFEAFVLLERIVVKK